MLSTWTAQPGPALSANRWELIFAELTTLSARSQQLIKLFPFSPKPGLPHLTHHRLLSPVVSSFPITLTQTHRDFLVCTIGPRRERQTDRQTDRPYGLSATTITGRRKVLSTGIGSSPVTIYRLSIRDARLPVIFIGDQTTINVHSDNELCYTMSVMSPATDCSGH